MGANLLSDALQSAFINTQLDQACLDSSQELCNMLQHGVLVAPADNVFVRDSCKHKSCMPASMRLSYTDMCKCTNAFVARCGTCKTHFATCYS